MKKLIILLIFCSTLFLQAQDKEPNPWHFKWGNSSSLRPFVQDSFPQTSFFTGFQWSGSTKMDNALGNNSKTGKYYQVPSTTVLKPINWLFQPTWFDSTDYFPGYFGAVMMQYDPTLPLNILNEGNILRPNDPSDPIFGFEKRKGTILTNPTDPNYSRLILYKDSSYVDSTVLSNIWPQPNFHTYNWHENHYLGRKWYLAINLKRLNPSTDIIKDDDVVLKIKIPYTRWDNVTGYIKFNKLPINNQDSTEELYYMNPDSASKYSFIDSRGYAQLMHIDTTTTIEITRRMIPVSTDPSENITIYAEFHTNGTESGKINPKFSSQFALNSIKTFDIQVQYMGGLDIAIDWVRVEEYKAHLLMRGELDWMDNADYTDKNGRAKKLYWLSDEDTTIVNDTTITINNEEVNDIYNTIESSLEHLKAKTNNWQDAKLYRFYFQDIESPSFFWWGAIRYCNKFTNGMYIVSDVPNYPELYEYYTGCSNRYFGLKFHPDESLTAQPYFRRGIQHWHTMGYKYGFLGEHWEDSLTSGYETFFANESRNADPNIYNHIKNSTMEDYFFHLGKSDAFQSNWELSMYDKFFNPLNYKYIYSDKGWYTNLFVGFNINLVDEGAGIVSNPENKVAVGSNVRSKTGEEIRTLFMTNLIMGAKGIYFDREESDSILHYDTVITNNPIDTTIIPRFHTLFGLGDGTNNAYYNANELNSFIESDTLGGDYPNGIGDIYNIADFINKDTISKYAMIRPDRVYLGTKSVRVEMKNLIDWIRLNDIELMDMRLQATYSKGFKTFENWNPYKFQFWGKSPLRSIVNLDSIKTRKIFEPKANLIHNINPGYEDRDSSFFDITLLQFKNSEANDIYNNKNAVYLGIQNRRTDPLIFRDSIDTITSDSLRELMFFSSAEFDDRVRYGGTDLWGVNEDSTWWQNEWWKRLGIREINIPLNIKTYGNGTYIVASEIGIDSLDKLGWRYDDKYYHRIDTLLNYNDSLKVKLLPGQGKIVKLDFVPYFFNDPTKDSIPDNDSCYFCDIFNDFELFDFNVETSASEFGCCYDVSLTYNGNCRFDDIPLKLLFEGETGNTFMNSDPMWPLMDSLGTNIKYKNITMNFDSTTGTVSLGTFCVSDTANTYKISLLAGKDKDNVFIGCDRELAYKVKCKGDTAVKSCCDGLNVAVTFSSTGQGLNSLECTTWILDSNYNPECIYGVSVESSQFYRVIEPVGNTPIAKGSEYTVCYSPFPGCVGLGDSSYVIYYISMKFLGKDGTVLCEKQVPIRVPCMNALNDMELEPQPKNISFQKGDREDSKTYNSESYEVTIWPNPTTGALSVEINSKVKTVVDINLVNNIGVGLSKEDDVKLIKGLNEKSYNLTDFPSGVYYLQINGKDGNIVLPIMLNK